MENNKKKRYKPTEENVNKLFQGVPVKEVLFLRDEETPMGDKVPPSGCNMRIELVDGTTLTIESDINTEITLEKV